MAPQKQKKLDSTSPNAAKEARDQATAYDSVMADIELELDDGTTMTIPPHPDLGMLDDDRLEAYEELLFERESYDRDDDIFIPEQRLKDTETGKETGVVLPATTRRGQLKIPYRRTDSDGNTELIKPPHSVKVIQAVLGDADYKRLTEGGRSAKDVWRIWGRQGIELQEREAADPKSVGSLVDLEAVSTPDSE